MNQVRVREVRASQECTGEVGASKVRVLESCPGHDQTSDGGTQVQAGQVRPAEVRRNQERHSGKACAGQVCAAEVYPLEVRIEVRLF